MGDIVNMVHTGSLQDGILTPLLSDLLGTLWQQELESPNVAKARFDAQLEQDSSWGPIRLSQA